jgi:Asp-tRNA(Asn)/Glu-tRNA(Gln) amidotransferase C subunit
MAYIWHPVTESEKDEIRKNAKDLLDEFSSKLNKIETSAAKPEDKENLRVESKGSEPNKEFQEIMFDNAPMVEDGLIIAEKGAWKK